MATPSEASSKDPVDAVLLIDGDNDPHFPPEFQLTPRTLVRVFVRVGAKMPRGLEKRLADLPMAIAVVSPKGGANAADFVMSLHCGMLHTTLPMHIPFTLVTHDKSLSVMCQELQRIGRRAELWTSHPERGGRAPRAPRATVAAGSPAARTSRGGGRGRGRGRVVRAPARVPAAVAAPSSAPVITQSPAPFAAPGRGVAQIAASYAARLGRIKDPPSRLKTLLNDIKNRAGATGLSPEDILEELKRSQVLSVDSNGKVLLQKR
jgi:hypothetical protein